jgi:hypothetical protein
MPSVSKAVAELTHELHEVQDVIRRVKPEDMTSADRAALRALLDELALLVGTAKQLT